MDPRFQQLYDLFSHLYELERVLNDLVVSFRQRIQQEVEIEAIRKLSEEFAARYDKQRSALLSLMDQIYGLIKELMESGGVPGATETAPVKPAAVADQFRKLMDAIQLEARQPRAGESATTLKNMEIELKGLVVIEEDEARIVPPQPGSQVDPGLLSTIRLSFGTIPVLRPQAEQPPSPPPAATTPVTPSAPTRIRRTRGTTRGSTTRGKNE